MVKDGTGYVTFRQDAPYTVMTRPAGIRSPLKPLALRIIQRDFKVTVSIAKEEFPWSIQMKIP